MEKINLISKLMEEGFSFIEEGLSQDAIKVGRQLKKLRHSSAFEIMALGYRLEGALSKTIAVLEEGVRKADRVWVLWELLGNCYSDARRFNEAENAYQKALSCAHANGSVIHLNRAVAFGRAGNASEAAAAIRHVKSPPLLRRADACRIRVALQIGQKQNAQRIARRLWGRTPERGERHDPESQSEICLVCALALRHRKQTSGKALRLAFRAVEHNPNNNEALKLIREIAGREATHRTVYRLMIQGVWSTVIGKSRVPPGFFRSVEVAGANEQAAFAYAKPFFPAVVRKSLLVEKSKTLRNLHVALEGVYFLSGYCFYPRRNKK